MEQLTSLFKAFSDQNRLRILAALHRHNSLCACDILALLGISGATLSRHMGILVSTQLVQSEKRGKWVHYSLAHDHVAQPVLEWLLGQFNDSPQIKADTQVLAITVSNTRKKVLCSGKAKRQQPEKETEIK